MNHTVLMSFYFGHWCRSITCDKKTFGESKNFQFNVKCLESDGSSVFLFPCGDFSAVSSTWLRTDLPARAAPRA